MSWCSAFAEICRADAPLRELTWYRLGGPARWLLEPRSESEAAAVVCAAREAGVPLRVLGRGANVLVRDQGFPGAVLRLAALDAVTWRDDHVEVAAGNDFPKFVRETLERGLVGLEALAGIPGLLGGIVRMNAGGKYGEISTFVQAVRLIDPSGRVVTRSREQIPFSYRHSGLEDCVVLGATLKLARGDREAALNRHREIWSEKHAQQPAVADRSCGCIFKNPPGRSAGRLLDEAGMKGVRVRGAEISTKHANFILAGADASAQDVLDLIALAKDRVWNHSGVKLELEVDVW